MFKNLFRHVYTSFISSFLCLTMVFLCVASPTIAYAAPKDHSEMVGGVETVITPTFSQSIVQPTIPYTSERLYHDVEALVATYPTLVSSQNIGTSTLGKNIPVVKLGTGSRKLLWVGAIHAREVVTTGFLLLLVEEYASAYSKGIAYGKYTQDEVKRLLEEFTIYIVPMANPDGVDIVVAQGASNVTITTPSTFKGNANGVDLNRNFPFDWIASSPNENNNHLYYAGISPASELETKALISLCDSVSFEHLITCHVQGKMLFWRDNKNGSVPGDIALQRTIAKATGYKALPSTSFAQNGWSGGLDNWFRAQYNRPALCIEFASYNTADPQIIEQFYTKDMMNWATNQNLLFAVLKSIAMTTTNTHTSLPANTKINNKDLGRV